MRHWLPALLLAATLPTPALAWNQAVTGSGAPLHWSESCVYYTLSAAGSDDVPDLAALADAVRRGFDAWNVPCSAVALVDGGISDCTRVSNPRANLVMWLEDAWPYPSDLGDPYAVTSVFYDSGTGEILDANVEFNGVDFAWNTEGLPEGADVWNTMAHEAGHVLGLDHSSVVDATMYLYSERGETHKRDLADDDLAGICAIYPEGSDLTPCGEPPGDRALCIGQERGCGCALAGTSGARGIAVAALLVLLVAMTSARQRARRCRARPHRRERRRDPRTRAAMGPGAIHASRESMPGARARPASRSRRPHRAPPRRPRSASLTTALRETGSPPASMGWAGGAPRSLPRP